jgi:hypothetical protein
LICCLQLLMVLANIVILRCEPREAYDQILLSQIRDSPNLDGRFPVFISLRSKVAQIYPQTLGFLSLFTCYPEFILNNI